MTAGAALGYTRGDMFPFCFRGSRAGGCSWSFALAGVVVLFPGAALAQPLPEGTRAADPASKGATDVGGAGFQNVERPAEEDKDVEELEVAAGGLIATGNARQVALTGSSKFKLRRDVNQLRAAAALNYARAATADDEDGGLVETVSNVQGQLRYDFFFAEHWSFFTAVTARRDRFQGLNLRLNIDPGVAYYIVDQPKQQLWVEAGYDFQHDVRRDENLAEARATGEILDKTESRHSVRTFAGYDNKLNERVSLATGLEYIQSVQETDIYRLNWDASLTSNIAGRFSTAVTLSLKYDSKPLPGVETLDIVSAFNLVYSML
jgi:putative salt-induced outer membrane protein